MDKELEMQRRIQGDAFFQSQCGESPLEMCMMWIRASTDLFYRGLDKTVSGFVGPMFLTTTQVGSRSMKTTTDDT